jgi:hypothetical protein
MFSRSDGVLALFSIGYIGVYRNHRSTKRGGLDELKGDVAKATYTHPTT